VKLDNDIEKLNNSLELSDKLSDIDVVEFMEDIKMIKEKPIP